MSNNTDDDDSVAPAAVASRAAFILLSPASERIHMHAALVECRMVQPILPTQPPFPRTTVGVSSTGWVCTGMMILVDVWHRTVAQQQQQQQQE